MVGDLDGVQGLIQSGAKLCPQTHEGSTPLHFAALHNQSDIASLLLKSGADPYVTDGQVFLCPACCDPVLMTRNGCSYNACKCLCSLNGAGADTHLVGTGLRSPVGRNGAQTVHRFNLSGLR